MTLELGNSNAERWNSQANKWEYYQKPIRQLIVNNSERYRLVIKNTLMYAKGKINLDLNWGYDGSGESCDQYYGSFLIKKAMTRFSEVYAFYGDGFYSLHYKKYPHEKLSDFINNVIKEHPSYFKSPTDSYYPWPLTFKGWYTEKEKGRKIETIEDLFDYTDLFDFKENKTMPEITLYAHWELLECTIKVHNIRRRGAKSSCEYNGKWTDKSTVATFKVPYRTEAISYVNARIKNFKYITWAEDSLDGTNWQQSLRAGPQQFIGWTINDYVTVGSSIFFTKMPVERNIDLYPGFETLMIWKQCKVQGKKYGGVFKVYSGVRSSSIENTSGIIVDGNHYHGSEGIRFSGVDYINEKDAPALPWQFFEGEWPNRVHHHFFWDFTYRPSYRYTYQTDLGTGEGGRNLGPSTTIVFTATDTKEYG